ncbi:MAG: endolytic transglycosylase MltG [Rhodospirillales bacterium]|nr:MAG: endolytic transglycosylase MltG [Rhodospirillales bacterium]
MKRLLVIAATLLGMAALLFLGLWWSLQQFLAAPLPLSQPLTLVVSKGAGLAAITQQLSNAGVIGHPLLFRLGTMWMGRTKALQAGEYAFEPGMSHRLLIDKMALGEVVVHRFTLVEGRTVRQLLDELKAEPALEGEVGPLPGEGRLLPETYNFILGETRSQMIARMQRAMDQALMEAWNGRDEGLLLSSPTELLILASIVERETGLAAERPHVAAVFHNRLKKGMRLQSDPTAIYALSDGLGVLERPLSRADLENPSPFNTYVVDRLPPAPIANPGRASLMAVAHPQVSNDLYFVADGTGGHVFAATLEAHNQNVARWRQIEKERGK